MLLRRLMLVALALCALLAMAGCGANRLMGPLGDNGAGYGDHGQQGTFSDRPREDDPRDPGANGDPVVAPEAAGDTLRTAQDGGL